MALGHPIASGARILVTLLHAMKQKDVATGMASLASVGQRVCSPSSASIPRATDPADPRRDEQSDLPSKIAVIGAGTMGNGIAQVFARGSEVTLVDLDAAPSTAAARSKSPPAWSRRSA